MSNLSIKAKLLVLALVIIVLVSGTIAIESMLSISKFSNKNMESYSQESYNNKEKELKNYVSLAMKTVEAYYERTSIDKVKLEVQDHLKEQTNFLLSILNSEYEKYKDSMSREALEYRLKSIIDATRYGESGYFWVNDTDAVIVIHPIKPALNGKDMANYKDELGKRIFFEFAKVAKEKGEGFVDYVWPKPGFEKAQLKISYVKLFKPFNWVIGTGEYVDDVTAKIQEEAKKVISEMRYGSDGYFWINNSQPIMLMHPINPALNGTDLSSSKDAKGNSFFTEMAKVANEKKEGGLVSYWWDKPGKKNDPKEKFSYVQKFEQWDWIIGTGAYVDDIESDINAMKKNTAEEIKSILIATAIYSLIAIIIAYLIYTYLINKTIITPLNNLNNAVKDLTNSNSASEEITKTSNDEIGKLVDSFNAYVGKLKEGYLEDAKVIEEVDKVIAKVNNGFYVYKVTQTSSNPLIVKLRDSINSMIMRTNENLVNLNNILIEYGNSNFASNDKSIKTTEVNGIISSLVASTNLIGVTVSEFLAMIVESGKKLNDDTQVLSVSANRLSSSANEQAASLEETAAAVEEITSIVKSSVQNVMQMSMLANDLSVSSKEGQDLASKTTKAMEDIDEQVKSINEAITVIDQIAFQTNILSLNAAVEAATAGEAGKGFAVVAQEVRNLAARSAEAAKEIKSIVESATSKANEGKVIANNMIGGYASLNDKINQTIGLIENVTQASKEEEKGIVQINDAINALDKATQINANSATTISELAEEVSSLSNNLLLIADRAKFRKIQKDSISDIDLVFRISKLKNDHIKFKNDNFDKLGSTKVAWSVTKANECDLGKWIVEQESAGKDFTRTSNWKTLKENHELVHGSVQSYINEDCKGNVNNQDLIGYSKSLDDATHKVFECLEQIKIDNIKNVTVKTEVNKMQKSHEKPAVTITKKVETKFKDEKITTSKPNSKVITSKTTDDDEWESF